MTAIIEAAYEGSTAVRINGRPYSYTPLQARGGVLPRVARQLINDEADPDSVVRVTRDGSKVFADASLGQWAGITYEEQDNAKRSIRQRSYRLHSSEREAPISGGQVPDEATVEPPRVLAADREATSLHGQ